MSILNKIKLVDVFVNGHKKNDEKVVLDDFLSSKYNISELSRISNECNIFSKIIIIYIFFFNNVYQI